MSTHMVSSTHEAASCPAFTDLCSRTRGWLSPPPSQERRTANRTQLVPVVRLVGSTEKSVDGERPGVGST